MKNEKIITVKDLENIGPMMRKIRRAEKTSATTVAGRMNISKKAFSRIEQGHVIPRLDTLLNFCDVMGIEVILKRR